MSIWVETTSLKASRPSRTTAAAVSSQEVSRPRVSITPHPLRRFASQSASPAGRGKDARVRASLDQLQRLANLVRGVAVRLQPQVLVVRALGLVLAVGVLQRQAERQPRL